MRAISPAAWSRLTRSPPQRFAEQAVVGTVTGVPGAMAPHKLAAARKHERATELVPVLFGPGLGAVAALGLAIEADAFRATPRHPLRRKPKDLPQRAPRQIHRLVGSQVRGQQHREAHAGLLLEGPRLRRGAHPDQPDIGVGRQQVAVAFELHGPNAALHAQVVPQKDDRRGTVAPQLVKLHLRLVLVVQDEPRQGVHGCLADGCLRHGERRYQGGSAPRPNSPRIVGATFGFCAYRAAVIDVDTVSGLGLYVTQRASASSSVSSAQGLTSVAGGTPTRTGTIQPGCATTTYPAAVLSSAGLFPNQILSAYAPGFDLASGLGSPLANQIAQDLYH